jgi:FkbM family methyltransferase
MSDINLQWVNKVFNFDPITMFDIGCADMQDTINFKHISADSLIYAFDCNDFWFKQNTKLAIDNGIHYFHCAFADRDGEIEFTPSLMQGKLLHPFSGSIYAPINLHGKVYGEPMKVQCTTFDTFCKNFNISPDFLHIDTEGAEFIIFQHMKEFKPKLIWSETCGMYEYDTKKTGHELSALIVSLGYTEIYTGPGDSLFRRNDFETIPYVPL